MRALTRVATPGNEAKLLEMALIATGAQLERLCRGYRGVLDGERTPAAEERSVRQRLLPGGMVKLDAGEAEAAEAAGVSAQTCWPSRADGAVKLAESFLAGNPVTGTGG